MNILGSKIINLVSRLLEDQRILVGLLIISILTVVYSFSHVRSDLMQLIPEGKPPVNYIQEYSGNEMCQQRGLCFFIAINKLWLSISTVPAPEQIQGGRCNTGNSDLCGDSLAIRVSLTL